MTVITKENVSGDVPGRLRVLIENLSTQTQRGLLYAIRSRFRGDGTDPMEVEAEALTPLGGAALAALSGASGGGNNVVRHTDLPEASWLAILETKIAASGAQMTHVGPHEIWARIHDPGATAGLVKLRLEWFTGDATRPTLNRVVETPLVGDFALVNLGEIIPKRARAGKQTWIGRVLAKAVSAGADVNIDKLYVLPTGEGYGRIVALHMLPTPTTFTARDEFNQSAGALNAKALPIGGTWATSGTGADFTVEAAGHTAQRTGIDAARYAIAGASSLAAAAVQADIKVSAHPSLAEFGLLARWASSTNHLKLVWNENEKGVSVVKVVAGTPTTLGSKHLGAPVAAFVDALYTLALAVQTDGSFAVFAGAKGSLLTRRFAGQDADLAAAGALASGNVGLIDNNGGGGGGATRNYDNFAAWVPESDAVLYPSRTAELRTDGYSRQSSDGAASAPIVIQGALLRMPVSGQEGRPVEVFLETSRGDLDQLPDSGLDSLAARVLHRPSYLFPPRS